MPTYYEVLRLPSTASAGEIETAIEVQYNYWRRLVTHHEPQTAQRANQALLYLEQIRTTLTDPVRRANYDATLGQPRDAAVGGLADPQLAGAVSPTPPFAPPTTPFAPPSSLPVTSSERVDAWTCLRCGKASPVGSMYCKSCGATLGQMCQQCNTTFEANASFCPVCGETPERVTRRRQLQAQVQQKQAELSALAGQAAAAKTQMWLLDTLAVLSLGWVGFMMGLMFLFGPLSVLRLLWGLIRNQPWMATETAVATARTVLTILSVSTGIARLVVWCLALAYFVFVMLARRKFNWIALAIYIPLSLIGIGLSGANLNYYGYPRGNWSLFFPALVVGGLAPVAGFLLYRRERLAWPGVALAELLVAVVLCASPQASALGLLAIVPQTLLIFLVGLIGFRTWIVADLETRRAFELEAEQAQQSARLAKEIEGLDQELALLGTKAVT